ncbi:unnamed protein product, partial [marine sediment metagenome]
MNCIKCMLRRWYYTLLKILMLPIRKIAGGINIEDQIIATLRDKDGKILKRIVGPKMHNKWMDSGLDAIAQCLRLGCSAAPGLKGEYMRLGSQCSDTGFTYIDGTEETTVNSDPGANQVRFIADWTLGPVINNICQVQLRQRSYTGSGTINSSIYNFGTQFNKPSGV